jgi:hypothetical protein
VPGVSHTGWAKVLLLCLSLLACQAVLGDFEVQEAPSVPGNCGSGQLRCREARLYCVYTVDGQEQPELVDTCGSAELCDSMLGRCDTCETGDFRCNGALLETCKDDRSGWRTFKECASPEQCNLPARDCRPCNLGDAQCSGDDGRTLLECDQNHNWLPNPQVCATKEVCEASIAAGPSSDGHYVCKEPGCTPPDSYACEGGVALVYCPADQVEWQRLDSCASPELCQSTIDDRATVDATRACVDPVCSPIGVLRCNGTALEQCNTDLQGWGLVDNCLPPFQCSTNTPKEAPTCSGPCTPGDKQCNNNFLETCSERQLWEERVECVSAGLCSTRLEGALHVGECLPPVCEPAMAYSCMGNQLVQCNPAQTAWEAVGEACLSVALCNSVDARCDEPLCQPAGAVRCNPASPLERQVCSDDLTAWGTVTTCSPTQSCDTDPLGPHCIDRCPVTPTRCNGANHEVCTGDTGAPVWTVTGTCPTAELCTCGLNDSCSVGIAPDGVCGLPACDAGATECSGSTLRTCQAGRNAYTSTNCAPYLCINASVGPRYCGVCSGSQAQCSGASIQYCNTATQLWNASQNCALGGCMGAGPNAYCPECTSGQTRCTNNDVQRCGSDRRWMGTTEDCGARGCGTNPSGVAACRECDPGARRCNNNDVQHCGSDGFWGASDDCGSLGCLTDTSGAYCAECSPAGATRCQNGDRQTCGMDRRWGSTQDCGTFDCLTNSSGAYCGVCSEGATRCQSGDKQTCGMDQLWSTTEDCGTFSCHSSSSSVYCGICGSGDARCMSGDREICGTDQLWSSVEDCGSFTCTGAAPGSYCPECVPDDARCQNNDKQVCGQNQLWGAFEECGTLGCVGTTPNAYCATCTNGDTRCSDGLLQTCASSLWPATGTGMNCQHGCYGTAPSAYCGICTPGTVDCASTTERLVCGDDGRWPSTPEPCSIACIEGPTGDYCAECDEAGNPCASGNCVDGLCQAP